MTKYKVLDLFAGAGGLSVGFEQAGFEIVCGVELFEEYCETYKANHKNSKVIQGDLHELESSEILKECGLKKEEIDVIIGGPPCKGFSAAARGRWTPEHWRDDKRNLLVFRFAHYVDEIRPKIFLMENVPGLLTMEKGKVIKQLHEVFTYIGYKNKYEVLNSADYGAPQKRRRVIFIGRIDGNEPKFPEPTHSENPKQLRLSSFSINKNSEAEKEVMKELLPWVTVKEAFSNIDFSKYPNHEIANHKDFMIERMKNLKPGDSLYENYSESWKRLVLDEPSPTVKENHNAPFVHPTELRVLTVRECALLQGFPLEYEFKGPKSKQLKQVGNAVPVQLAKALALSIMNQLDARLSILNIRL